MNSTKALVPANRIAFSYVRFSTARQKTESLRRQIAEGKRWCKENGYVYSDRTFLDEGKSGYSGKNLAVDKAGKAKGDLRKFIDLVEAGEIPRGSVLLCEAYDRFSRLQPFESFNIFSNLINAGIGVVFVMSYEQRVLTAELLNKEPHLLMMVIGEAIRAHRESDRKSQMIKASKQKQKETIQSGGIVRHTGVPRYFDWNPSTKRYEHNDKVQIVQRIVKEYLDGKSLYQIAIDLNKQGIKSIKCNTVWSPVTIRLILQSKCIIGEYMGNPNFFKPIIDNETFDKIKVRLSQNSGNRGKPASLPNVFKTLVYCQCGAKMNLLTQSEDYAERNGRKNIYRYYRCSSITHGRPCPYRKSVHAERLELDFFLGYMQATPGELLRSQTPKESKKATALQTELVEINRNVSEATELVGLVPIEELKRKLQKLEIRRQEIKNDLEKAFISTVASQQTPQALQGVKDILKRLALDNITTPKDSPDYRELVHRVQNHLLNKRTREIMRQLLPSIISKITVDTGNGQYSVTTLAGNKSPWRSL